jgi:phage tail-like protein
MGSENEIVEYKAAGEKGEYVIQKVPGRLKWNNITLKRGVTNSLDLWKWRKLVEQGKITDARKNGSIAMNDAKGACVARWDFINAWPSKLVGPAPNAGTDVVAIEELELTVEGYERTQ